MHAYFPPADAAAPAAAGAGEAADGSDQRTAALPAGAPAPPQAAASGPEVAMPSYQPWKQSRPEWKGCTAEQWAASRCKTDDYIAPTMPKGSAPGKMWSFGVCQKGAAVGTKQWSAWEGGVGAPWVRCLCTSEQVLQGGISSFSHEGARVKFFFARPYNHDHFSATQFASHVWPSSVCLVLADAGGHD